LAKKGVEELQKIWFMLPVFLTEWNQPQHSVSANITINLVALLLNMWNILVSNLDPETSCPD